MNFVGSTVTFAHVFEVSGTPTDPTSIRLLVREGIDGVELEWIYNAAPVSGTHYPVGMNPIARNGAGNFDLDFVARKAERLTGIWIGTGTVNDSAQQTFLIRHTDVQAIENP